MTMRPNEEDIVKSQRTETKQFESSYHSSVKHKFDKK